MSSELFMFENSFFSDPFTDSPVDPHSHLPFEIFQENPVNESSDLDQIASVLFSSSPPSVELENLSITQLGNTEYSALQVKTELNFQGFTDYDGNSFWPQSFDGAHETAVRFMQRSYSSNSFENKQNVLFRPQFGSVLESDNLQTQLFTSPESSSSLSSGQMRRVCSTGDLHNVKINMQTSNVLSSSPLSTEKSFMEEANFKVGRYSAEERKEKIDRYRAKRTQRNFNKTIKYACRKTLADNRPRIRGRFARNDEAGEIPKASIFHRCEDEDDLWLGGFHEEDEEGVARRGSFFNGFGSAQYQNFSY